MNSIYSTRTNIGNNIYTTRHFNNKALKVQTLISYNGKEINVDNLSSNNELTNTVNQMNIDIQNINRDIIQLDDRVKNLESSKESHDERITVLENNNKELGLIKATLNNVKSKVDNNELDINVLRERLTNFEDNSLYLTPVTVQLQAMTRVGSNYEFTPDNNDDTTINKIDDLIYVFDQNSISNAMVTQSNTNRIKALEEYDLDYISRTVDDLERNIYDLDTVPKTTIGYSWRYYSDENTDREVEYNKNHETVNLEDTLLQFMNDIITTLAHILNPLGTTFMPGTISKS